MQDKKRIYILLGIVMALALTAEILFAAPHHHMIWNELPGADIVIGFAGAWILILIAKKFMVSLFQRREDYYDEGKKRSREYNHAGEDCRGGRETVMTKDGGGRDA